MQEKRKKWGKWACIIGLVVLIAFVIITSIVIYHQKQRLNDLQDANDQISDSLDDPENGEGQEGGQDITEESVVIYV